MVEIEIKTRCTIPMWRTFGRIEWHVIPDPPATLQGAATWRIQCHDPRVTCHIAGCNNSISHIENRFSPYFIFFNLKKKWSLGFDKRQISYRLRYTCFVYANTDKTDRNNGNAISTWSIYRYTNMQKELYKDCTVQLRSTACQLSTIHNSSRTHWMPNTTSQVKCNSHSCLENTADVN